MIENKKLSHGKKRESFFAEAAFFTLQDQGVKRHVNKYLILFVP